jgi:hypothetical protein
MHDKFLFRSLSSWGLALACVLVPAVLSSCRDETSESKKVPKKTAEDAGPTLTDAPRLQDYELQVADFRGPECGHESVISAEPVCGAASFRAAPHASCGVIKDEREHPSCGVRAYNSGTHPACGVAMYQERVDPLCGRSSRVFWSGWGRGCPSGSSGPDTVIGVVSGRVEFRVKGIELQKRTECTETVTHRCRRPEFGPESFHSCPHESFGVASYKRCAVAIGFKTCPHPDNGPATFKACEVKKVSKSCAVAFDSERLEAWLSKHESDLSKAVQGALESAARYYGSVGQPAGAVCLRSRLVRGDFFSPDEAQLFGQTFKVIDAVARDAGQSSEAEPEGAKPDDVTSTCHEDTRVTSREVCAANDFNHGACLDQRRALEFTEQVTDLQASLRSMLEQQDGGELPEAWLDRVKALLSRVDRILDRATL